MGLTGVVLCSTDSSSFVFLTMSHSNYESVGCGHIVHFYLFILFFYFIFYVRPTFFWFGDNLAECVCLNASVDSS